MSPVSTKYATSDDCGISLLRPLGGESSPFKRTCLEHCPDPDKLETIGRAFPATAAELRLVMSREVGHA